MTRGLVRIATLGVGALASCGFDGPVLVLPGGADGAPLALDAGDAGDAAVPGTVSTIVAGQASTCALVLGSAFCWGSNAAGGLGIGTQQDESAPARVQSDAVYAAVVVGDQHACALDVGANAVACWGGNTFGQLGVADTLPRTSPAHVDLAGPVREIAAGFEFSCALLAAGSLVCWGENDEGQLGQGDAPGAPNATAPVPVGGGTDWMHVGAGQGHACAIRAPGSLWCWGRNTAGELGIGPNTPIQIRAPTRVGADDDWASLDLGQDTACALKEGGTLWCWGADFSDQLGFPGDPDASESSVPTPTQVGSDADWVEVSIDTFHACALKRDGTLWCWGRNLEGQLGLGDNMNRALPTRVGTGTTWLVVSAGRFHTCAETADHAVYCTGQGSSGALGLGDTVDRNVLSKVTLPPVP